MIDNLHFINCIRLRINKNSLSYILKLMDYILFCCGDFKATCPNGELMILDQYMHIQLRVV